MIDFNHEVAKLTGQIKKKVISENAAKYEALKLQCLAAKFRKSLVTPVECALTVDMNVVNEDMRELTDLYKSGLLKKRQFIRDNMKILALCEAFGIQFPGDKSIADRINIRCITEAVGDSDDLGDLSEDDDFDDLPDDEDFGEDGDELYFRFNDGVELVLWANASEHAFGINWNRPDRRPAEEVSEIDIFECLLLHRNEAMDWLELIASICKSHLDLFIIPNLSSGQSEYYQHRKEESELLLDIINGKAKMSSDVEMREGLDYILSELGCMSEAFSAFGIAR